MILGENSDITTPLRCCSGVSSAHTTPVLDTTVSTVRSVLRISREVELPFLAGSIAFFAFLSIIPALLLVLSFGSALGGEAFASAAVSLFQTYLSEEGRTVISEALADPAGIAGASLVGIAVLLWSVFRTFSAIDIAFDRIYGAERSTSLPQQLFNGAVVVVTITTGLFLAFSIRLVLARIGPELSVHATLVSLSVLLVGLVIILVPLYYVMPPVRIPLRHVVPGTITAAIGFIALQEGFRMYTSIAGQYQAYGFLGAVLIFQLWLYFGALALLVGAVVNIAVSE